MAQRPDGWSRNDDGTWAPPVRAVQHPPLSKHEVPYDVKNTIIKDGVLEVYDATGLIRARIGKVGDEFDVRVYDSAGNDVRLSTLAFSMEAAEVQANEECTAVANSIFSDLTTVGPSVTVTVGPSGRALVSFGALCSIRVDTGDSNFSEMTFEVTGATSLPVVEGGASLIAAADRGVRMFNELRNGSAGEFSNIETSIHRSFVVDGLNPGEHTFTGKYRSNAPDDYSFMEDRYIVVQPF